MELGELESLVDTGEIDTVVVAFSDHYGRLAGKRLDARFFLSHAADGGTHACDYLLTTDIDMEPVAGYAFANWDGGYGDVHLQPDLTTLRRAAWADRTAIVLCDAVDQTTHDLVDVAPRTVLRRQVEALTAAGYTVQAASELELFLYRTDYRTAEARGYAGLDSAGWHVEDYQLLGAARVEDVLGPARRALTASEIPVESTKGEAAIGQHEINIVHAPVLEMADRHTILKQAVKEIADGVGASATFMAKPHADQPGSSCHLHLSLWHDGASAFAGETDEFRWFLGGWMSHAADLMACYAPTVNSYKRFQARSWAPVGLAWGRDNRTTGFRVVGSASSLRIECRLPGADVNPYLAFAAALASGLDGINNRIEPPPEHSGDAYADDARTPPLPSSLAEAAARFGSSTGARRLLSDAVVDHYAHHAAAEAAAYGRAVTDWERTRYFERI